jgi:hypothetical protein
MAGVVARESPGDPRLTDSSDSIVVFPRSVLLASAKKACTEGFCNRKFSHSKFVEGDDKSRLKCKV